MSLTQEYRGLAEQARDSLYALLRETEPGTGLLLHRAYRALRDQLEEDAPEAGPHQPPECDPGLDESRRPRSIWRRMSRSERIRLLFDVLGDDRLTVRALAERMTERCEGRLSEQDLRPLVYRLHSEGKLDRTREHFRKGDSAGCFRYHYFKWSELAGPIADLERRLQEGGS
jgi:hypothetical protein